MSAGTARSACLCDPGFHGEDGGPCAECALGTYKPTVGSARCVAAHAVLCASGWYRERRLNECAPCPANTWKRGSNNATSCSREGSVALQHHLRGLKVVVQDPTPSVGAGVAVPCTECYAGSYSSTIAATSIHVCLDCVSGKYSASRAATAAANCTDCAPGKFSPTSPGASELVCVSCPAGTYSATSGASQQATCTQCVSGKYSTETAAPSVSNCTACAAGKRSNTPAATSEGQCADCPAGTYTAAPDSNTVCTPCPIDTFSDAVGARNDSTCVLCNSTQVSTAGARACVTCAAGKYKPPQGVECALCPHRHYCTGGVAIECNVNSQLTPPTRQDASAPRDCSCNAGYSHRPNNADATQPGPENVCHACSPGFYSESTGTVQCSPCGAGLYSPINASLSAGNCQQCAPDSFSGAGERECTACPDNTQAPAGSGLLGNCICKPGFTGADGVMCTACPPGEYKTAAGSAQCTKCAAGKFSTLVNASSDTCEPCPAHSNAPEGSAAESACTCNAGAAGTNGGPTCVLCVAGTYSESQGAAACDNCASGNYSTVVGSNARANCTGCPPHSDSDPGSPAIARCKCVPGAAGPGGGPTCTLCPAGEYQQNAAQTQCDACAAGAYWLSDDAGAKSPDVCLFCLGASSSPVDKRCVCDNGHYTAELQFAGEYCGNAFAATFVLSGIHNAVAYFKADDHPYFQSSGDWYVYNHEDSQAWSMGTNILAVGDKGYAIAGAGADNFDVDLRGWQQWCNAQGTDWPIGITRVCAACVAGKYAARSGMGCADCAPGKFSAAVGAHDDQTCQQCPTGKYQAQPGSVQCVDCGAGYFLLNDDPGAASPDVCKFCNGAHSTPYQRRCACDDGYQSSELRFVGTKCETPYDETFQLLNTDLGVWTYQQEHSAAVEQNNGVYQKIYKRTTGFNSFTWEMGGNVAFEGQSHTTGVAGRDDADALLFGWVTICDASYEPWPITITRSCAVCVAGTYSAGADPRCTKCPAGKASSSPAQTSEASCVECVAGKYSAAAGTAECLECETGSYQSATGQVECVLCGAGKYNDVRASTSSEACTLCPVRSGSSPEGSREAAACKCNPGSSGPDGGPTCALCVPGKYQVDIGQTECEYCAAGKKLASPGSFAANDCTDCAAGLISSEGADACRACDAYAQRVGEALQANCKCNIGYYRTGVDFASSCTLCDSGTYKTVVGDDENLCVGCPEPSTDVNAQMCQTQSPSPDGGGGGGGGGGGLGGGVGGGGIIILVPLPSVAFVICNAAGVCGCGPGYTGEVGSCAACAVGKFKDEQGSEQCTLCHDFSFSDITGAEDEASCVCNAGYQQHSNGATCTECTTGQYKASVGDQACDSCAAGNYNGNTAQTSADSCLQCAHGTYQSEAGSSACVSCGVQSHSDNLAAIDSSHCECNAGHTPSTTTALCVECATGSYRSGPGNGACQLCAKGSYNANTKSITQNDCLPCAAGTYQEEAGAAACTACIAGKYGIDSGADEEAVGCLGCPQNTANVNSGNVGRVSCVCLLGYTGNDGEVCNACEPGTYKDSTGSAGCSSCPSDSGNNPAGSGALESCTCNPGTTGLDGSTCIPCAAGKFKTEAGAAVCGGCVAGEYSLAKALACETCPDNTRSAALSAALNECTCVAGYTGPDGAECTACVPGTYKIATGSAGCSACAPGTYNAASGRSATCDMCTANSHSPASSTSAEQCACNAGAEPSGGGATCALCSAGSYKSPTGADMCTGCTTGSHIATPGATANVCQCNAGWTGAQGAVCSECVAGTYKEGSGAAACVPCASGKFSDGVAAPLAATCLPCAAGKTTGGSDGRAAESQCVACAAGTYTELPEGNMVCTACPADTASPQPGATSSNDCALCSATQVAAANSSACTTCELGKFKSAELNTCVPCLTSHFCAGGAPVRCDANSQTSPLERTDAVSGGDCLCNTGYALRPFADYHTGAAVPSNACHPCPHGHYNSIVGVEECKACLAGWHVFANASTSISACAECGANTFSAAGAGECTPCADYSQGPAASGNARDCVCNAGFTGLPGGPCASCDAGKYKIEEG